MPTETPSGRIHTPAVRSPSAGCQQRQGAAALVCWLCLAWTCVADVWPPSLRKAARRLRTMACSRLMRVSAERAMGMGGHRNPGSMCSIRVCTHGCSPHIRPVWRHAEHSCGPTMSRCTLGARYSESGHTPSVAMHSTSMVTHTMLHRRGNNISCLRAHIHIWLHRALKRASVHHPFASLAPCSVHPFLPLLQLQGETHWSP